MKRIAITGAKGTLGEEMVRRFSDMAGVEVTPLTREDFDLRNFDEMRHALTEIRPNLLINCAAYNNVDAAEVDQTEAFDVNAYAVAEMARICKEIDARLVHFSTNYVFSGSKEAGYSEGNTWNPINNYGRSKREGEILLKKFLIDYYIIRTSWLFGKPGTSPHRKKNFPEIMMEKAYSGNPVRCPDDQFGQPTWTEDLAEAVIHLLAENNKYPIGTYHLASKGAASRYEWAKEIFRLANLNVPLESVSASSLNELAQRPKHGILLNTKAPELMPTWQDAVRRYMSMSSMAA